MSKNDNNDLIDRITTSFRLTKKGQLQKLSKKNKWENYTGAINGNGYMIASVSASGERYRIYVHRMVYLIQHGHWPVNEIDHIDRNKLNNHPSNLRDVSRQINQLNSKKGHNKANTSGFIGVYQHKYENGWIAYMKFHGKFKRIGKAQTPEAAARLRDEYIIKNNLTDRYTLNFS